MFVPSEDMPQGERDNVENNADNNGNLWPIVVIILPYIRKVLTFLISQVLKMIMILIK